MLKPKVTRPRAFLKRLADERQLRGDVLVLGTLAPSEVHHLTEAGVRIVGPFANLTKVKIGKKKLAAVLDVGVWLKTPVKGRGAYLAHLAKLLPTLGDAFVVSSAAATRVVAVEPGWQVNWRRSATGTAKLIAITRLFGPSKSAANFGTPPGGRRAVAFAASAPTTLKLDPGPIAAAQQCPNWCWAACLEMLCKSQGITVDQKVFVVKIYGTQANGKPPCVMSGPFENIKQALAGTTQVVGSERITLSGAYFEGVPRDTKGMIRAIQEKRPFIFAFNSHAYVCYGLTWTDRPAPQVPHISALYLIDPLWKLFPDRDKLTVAQGVLNPFLIHGTFELIVTRTPV